MLESAIPVHLQQERTLPSKCPHNYTPAFPSYMAGFAEATTELVMAIFGTQFISKLVNTDESMAKLTSFVSAKHIEAGIRPSFSEIASVVDSSGYYNETLLAYWPSTAAYNRWAMDSGFKQWWDGLDPIKETHGWFIEVFFPTVDRVETVFSHDSTTEGSAHMREGIRGPVLEHGYWGSMRDRLPVSQTDPLDGEKPDWKSKDGPLPMMSRVRVPGIPNLAVIRSGQDWKDTYPEERELYLNDIHPVLEKGMNFLRDRGPETGCYSCRFMEIVNPKTGKKDLDRTFGLGYFDELASLERWSREHPTHLDIFGGFLRYVRKLEGNITLHLFHEVLVLKPEQQFFEYVGCHPATGMLTAAYGHPGA